MRGEMFTHATATSYSAAAAVVRSLTSLDIRHAAKFYVYSCALVAPDEDQRSMECLVYGDYRCTISGRDGAGS